MVLLQIIDSERRERLQVQILRTAVDHVREVTAALLAAVDSVVLLHEDQFLCVALELCIF